MDENKDIFPQITKTISDFIEDEDGNITRNKLVAIGSMILLMTLMYGMDAYAGHRSHSSHVSHRSHSSGSGGHGNHYSHVSHQSHDSHSSSSHSSHSDHGSHSSHTSHSNTASHSNSRYSSEGDVSYGPAISSINGLAQSPVSDTSSTVSSTAGFDTAVVQGNRILNSAIPALPSISVPPETPKVSDIQAVDFYTEN